MSSSKLTRWSGLPCVAGGLLYMAFVAIHLLAGRDVNVIFLVANLLLLLGLVGLYARQVEQAGSLGVIGFLVAFIGTALFVGVDYADNFASESNLSAFFVSMGIFVLGYILFGIATMRAGVLPRWGGLLLAISVVLYNAPMAAVRLVGIPVFGAAFLWLGYALWSVTGEVAGQPQLAV